jgi:hypothetical protein
MQFLHILIEKLLSLTLNRLDHTAITVEFKIEVMNFIFCLLSEVIGFLIGSQLFDNDDNTLVFGVDAPT